jgi:tRNA threonylcarbamoyladenosine biosynthesis protein TsaE
MTFEIQNLENLPEIAQSIIQFTKDSPKVWTFKGEMGAGKTTLIKALGKILGVEDAIQSPTYSLVNEYNSSQVGKIYHFDLYRLKSEIEALDFGIEEYLDSGYYCWIEWAEQIPNLLPLSYLMFVIEAQENEQRIINISCVNEKTF